MDAAPVGDGEQFVIQAYITCLGPGGVTDVSAHGKLLRPSAGHHADRLLALVLLQLNALHVKPKKLVHRHSRDGVQGRKTALFSHRKANLRLEPDRRSTELELHFLPVIDTDQISI